MSALATREPNGRRLEADEARALTDSIRRDAQALWMQLLRAYEGNAHGALGYSNWADYCAAEFDFSKSRSYRLLQAAKVVELIDEGQSPMGDSTPECERVAREFAPLLDRPDDLRQAHADAVASAPLNAEGWPRVTAAVAREAVRKVTPQPAPTPTSRRSTPSATVRPVPSDTQKQTRTAIGLNDAVIALRRAVQRDPESIEGALAQLRESAARGLYTAETKDAPGAFRDLVELVALLLKEQAGGTP